MMQYSQAFPETPYIHYPFDFELFFIAVQSETHYCCHFFFNFLIQLSDPYIVSKPTV